MQVPVLAVPRGHDRFDCTGDLYQTQCVVTKFYVSLLELTSKLRQTHSLPSLPCWAPLRHSLGGWLGRFFRWMNPDYDGHDRPNRYSSTDRSRSFVSCISVLSRRFEGRGAIGLTHTIFKSMKTNNLVELFQGILLSCLVTVAERPSFCSFADESPKEGSSAGQALPPTVARTSPTLSAHLGAETVSASWESILTTLAMRLSVRVSAADTQGNMPVHRSRAQHSNKKCLKRLSLPHDAGTWGFELIGGSQRRKSACHLFDDEVHRYED